MNIKEILSEWNHFKSNNLLLEISKNEVVEVIGEDDYNTLVKTNRKASQDQNFLQVIINTYKTKENHSIEDILGQYQNYRKFIAAKWNRGEKASINVPGGYRASLTPDSTTCNDILKFIDASNVMNLKSKVYIECLKQGPVNPDFEVIINDSDWIICYPKTIRGSISLARSFWNGDELEYDKTVSGGAGVHIGYMNWCTSVVSGGNMFLNFYRAANLHMYYCIKKNMKVSDKDRKLCISFAKIHGHVVFKDGHSSVDANNTATSEEDFKRYIGNERFNTLFKDTEKPERLEIDEESYYESISLEQYKLLRAANENNMENFCEELKGILEHSRDKKEIFKLVSNDKKLLMESEIIRAKIAKEADNLSRYQMLNYIYDDESSLVRKQAALNKNCPPDIFADLLWQHKTKERTGFSVLFAMAENPNCPIDVLKNLIDGSINPTTNIRSNKKFQRIILTKVAANPNCDKELFEKFLNHDDFFVRHELAQNKNCPVHILETLVKDENLNVAGAALENKNCPYNILKDIIINPPYTLAVRKALNNPKMSSSLLKQILEEDNSNIKDTLSKLGPHVNTEIAKSKHCSAEILRTLSDLKSRFDNVKEAIVNNENTPTDVIKKIFDKVNNYNSIIISNRLYDDAKKALLKRGYKLEELEESFFKGNKLLKEVYKNLF